MNIVFDVGMVLVDFRWRDYALHDRHIPESSVNKLAERMILSPAWDEFDLSIVPNSETIEKFAEMFTDIPDDYRSFWEDIDGLIEPFSYSAEWLHSLKEQGHNVYLLSNYPKSMFESHMKKKFDFIGYTDGRVVSYEYHIMKPDPRIYEILLEKYSLDPADTVFLDDRQVNIDGAERCGIKGILFTNYEEASRKLDEIISERSLSK